MSLKTLFRKIQTVDADINTMQGFIASAFNTVKDLLQRKSDLVELTGSQTAAGSIVLTHPLGRIPFGWNVIDVNSAVTIYRSAWTTNSITLVVSGATSVTVEVW